jgi:hypothetical protein
VGSLGLFDKNVGLTTEDEARTLQPKGTLVDSVTLSSHTEIFAQKKEKK